MADRAQFRGGTTAQAVTADDILDVRELGIADDRGTGGDVKAFLGDGTSTYSDHVTDEPRGIWTTPKELDDSLGDYVPKTTTVNGHALSANVTVTKSDVGLSNVTNDAQIPMSYLDTDTTLAADSDSRVPSQHAVKTLIAASVAGLLDYKGGIDCSANPNYPAALKGDTYFVTVAGKIGGASGTSVDVSDMIVANADNAGGTQASVGTSWNVFEHNLVGALLASNNLSDVGSASTARTNLGLGTSATHATGDFAQTANNLSDLASVSTARTNLGLGTAATMTGPSGTIVGTTDTQALTNKDLTSGTNTFPTFNQNTTGSAAKLTTARNIAGVAFDGTASISLTSGSAVQKADGSGGFTAATAGTDYVGPTSGSAIQKANGAGGLTAASSGTDYAPATSGTAILKGNGSGAFSLAVSGTDYAPATSGSAILKGNGSGGFSSATAGTDYTSPSSTETQTNKRKQPRVNSQASTATLTPEIDTYDVFRLSAQAAALTIANHVTSTPADGEQMRISILDNGTARAISFGTNYVARGGVALPTTTTISKLMTLGFEWYGHLSKWVLMAVAQET